MVVEREDRTASFKKGEVRAKGSGGAFAWSARRGAGAIDAPLAWTNPFDQFKACGAEEMILFNKRSIAMKTVGGIKEMENCVNAIRTSDFQRFPQSIE
jgi:hypothetical protein